MTRRILLVDDDENLLSSLHRMLRKRYELDVALGGPGALKALEGHGPYAVIVADMQMPGMNGVELLKKVEEGWPQTIRLMLTGNLDQHTAMQAINQGHVFRFLTKPCTPEDLMQALDASLRQHALEAAERELLEQTLNGSLKVLTEILSVADPYAFGRAEVIHQRAIEVARALGMEQTWEVGAAALLAPLGRVTVPPGLIAKSHGPDPLTADELETLARVPEFGSQLLERIPRLEEVARIVRYQQKSYTGAGHPVDEVKGEDLPLGARILRVLGDLQDLEDRRGSRVVAFEQMRMRQAWYDPRVFRVAEELFGQPPAGGESAGPRPVAVKDLVPGLVLSDDVKTRMGMLVAAKGTRLLPSHVEKLQNFARLIGLNEPIFATEGN